MFIILILCLIFSVIYSFVFCGGAFTASEFFAYKALEDYCDAEEWEESERNADRRNQELIDTVKANKKLEELERKRTVRRILKEANGDIKAEEIIEEYV